MYAAMPMLAAMLIGARNPMLWPMYTLDLGFVDCLQVSHVIQYDFALDVTSYIHRVGRTARNGVRRVCWPVFRNFRLCSGALSTTVLALCCAISAPACPQ